MCFAVGTVELLPIEAKCVRCAQALGFQQPARHARKPGFERHVGWQAGKIEQQIAVATAFKQLAHELAAEFRIKPGDLVMLEAMGGGFTWGASLIRM